MAKIVVEMTAQEAGLWNAQQKLIQQQAAAAAAYGKTGQAAGAAGAKAKGAAKDVVDVGSMVKSTITTLASALGISGGLAGAIAMIKQGFEDALEIAREITSEVTKAGHEIIAFAALQEGGAKAQRVMAASALAAQYGITQRGEAFDTVQAMQSMLGSFEEGMKAAETIFQAPAAGVPVGLGKELEIRGLAAGMKPGEALRLAYAAGEVSGRTPAELVKVGEGLSYFEDKVFAFAAGAELAASAGDSLGMLMKRFGQILSPVGGLAEWYEEQGIPETATQFERLKAIQEAGVDTHILLKRAGVDEMRERLALVNALKRYPQIIENMAKIPAAATPDLFLRKRAAIEAEMPFMRGVREEKVLAARYAEAKAFGPGAMPAQQAIKGRELRGMAYKELGLEQLAWRTFGEVTKEGGEAVPDVGMLRHAWNRINYFFSLSKWYRDEPSGRFAPVGAFTGERPPGTRVATGREIFQAIAEEQAKIREEIAATAPARTLGMEFVPRPQKLEEIPLGPMAGLKSLMADPAKFLQNYATDPFGMFGRWMMAPIPLARPITHPYRPKTLPPSAPAMPSTFAPSQAVMPTSVPIGATEGAIAGAAHYPEEQRQQLAAGQKLIEGAEKLDVAAQRQTAAAIALETTLRSMEAFNARRQDARTIPRPLSRTTPRHNRPAEYNEEDERD